MALSFTQTPATINLSQSPIIFTLSESTSELLTSQSFQYFGDLYYWQGSTTNSGSVPNYTFAKYPNNSSVGIFDISKVVNSLFTQSVEENASQTYYFALEGYWGFIDNTGDLITGSRERSSTFTAYDGYALFGESIGEEIDNKTAAWPLLTDGPVSQSFIDGNRFSFYVNTSDADSLYIETNSGTTIITVSGSANTNELIQKVDYDATGITSFKAEPYSGGGGVGTGIQYELVCPEKYDNIRIKWKNRFGAFDFFNFNLVSRTAMQVDRQQYQPQLGGWENSTFGYENYESQIQNYLIDTQQTLQVNTDYVSEEYNDAFKQLLVSDEVYWIYDEDNGLVRPISIKTNSIQFKTRVVDKLIQYTFDFDWGQPYKLVL